MTRCNDLRPIFLYECILSQDTYCIKCPRCKRCNYSQESIFRFSFHTESRDSGKVAILHYCYLLPMSHKFSSHLTLWLKHFNLKFQIYKLTQFWSAYINQRYRYRKRALNFFCFFLNVFATKSLSQKDDFFYQLYLFALVLTMKIYAGPQIAVLFSHL